MALDSVRGRVAGRTLSGLGWRRRQQWLSLLGSLPPAGAGRCPGGETGSRAPWPRGHPNWGTWGRGDPISAHAQVPAAHSREDSPAVIAESQSLLSKANRQAKHQPWAEREGKEPAREEKAAATTSAETRGEPSSDVVPARSVPQEAVLVRPLALHLAHKAHGPGAPSAGNRHRGRRSSHCRRCCGSVGRGRPGAGGS